MTPLDRAPPAGRAQPLRAAPVGVPLPPVHATPAPPFPAPAAPARLRRRSPLRLAPALVPFTLVFGVLVAMAGSEVRNESPSLVAPTRSVPSVPTRPAPPLPPAPIRAGTPRPTLHGSRGAVERKVLAAVVQAPGGKLPRPLIDPRTGLARNNLQAVCRRAGVRTFLCVVRPLHHAKGEGLRVRYREGRGGGTFTWSRYAGR